MTSLDELRVLPPRERGLFCNRTLNMRAIRAVGYDMDYTLVHYDTHAWEERAYEHLKRRLAHAGFPTPDLEFDPDLVVRGLVIDTKLGNLCKANRFGFVKRAFHGTKLMPYDEQRHVYARTIVDLAESRWQFLNTLFSLSEATLYAQLVDRLDSGQVTGVLGYTDLYQLIRESLDATHTEGELKADITRNPDRYVVLEPDTARALLDQKRAGKRLLLVTNSEYGYTAAMMRYAFDRFLPGSMTWRELFDITFVAARKPGFFSGDSPVYEVVSDDGLLRPVIGELAHGGVYAGGHAALVERHLDLSGDEILYVGDHIYGDVHVSKSLLRWRTALIVRELEEEILATDEVLAEAARLGELMEQKTALEHHQCRLRLELARVKDPLPGEQPRPTVSEDVLAAGLQAVRQELSALDALIAPLARAQSEVVNPNWGPVMRAGNDKSHFTRQVERSADVYTSRVSNFLLHTPYFFLRSPRGSIPHDRTPPTAAAARGADNGD